MQIKDKAKRLFEYISQVYSIDLPVDRDVRKYGAELWWQAEIPVHSHCILRDFDSYNDNENNTSTLVDAWLSVTKKKYQDPPPLPNILEEWVELSRKPIAKPLPKNSVIRIADFASDKARLSAYDSYIKDWKELTSLDPNDPELIPEIPDILMGWINPKLGDDPTLCLEQMEYEEKFEESSDRIEAMAAYVENEWYKWAEKVLPIYRANLLYDQLFSLYQRLSVEGDRIEIMWGHLFLSWAESAFNNIYHPLILTSMNINFDPVARTISLLPSQITSTHINIDCLRDLEYPNQEKLVSFINHLRNNSIPPDAWNHEQMRGMAATISGLMSNEPIDVTNKYADKTKAKPELTKAPTIYNAPVIFVRERTRRLWVEDAKKISQSIDDGEAIPPFIQSLIVEPESHEMPDPADYFDEDIDNIEPAHHLLPLEYNEQQKEIVDKLKRHYGVLVQGPPGTGKSHTIANIICSLLARGKKVLVTSQTENALRVLRGYIPKGIQSLCVSQIGNDMEAKRQLNEAVIAIGNHLDEKGSAAITNNISMLEKEIRENREEQARISNQIKEWAQLDAMNIKIDGDMISAHEAAKECAENKNDHSWFPDKILPETSPPLNDDDLKELVRLLRKISSDDRKAYPYYLPKRENILSSEIFSSLVMDIKKAGVLAAETETERAGWGNNLVSASDEELSNTTQLLNRALTNLIQIKASWQKSILHLIISEERQSVFWRQIYDDCYALRDKAWKSYQAIQGYVISETVIDYSEEEPQINEIISALKKGVKLSTFLGRYRITKTARSLLKHITIDNKPPVNLERAHVAANYFSYRIALTKIMKIWNHSIVTVKGPVISSEAGMPLSIVDDTMKEMAIVLDWVDNCYKPILEKMRMYGCPNIPKLHMADIIENCLRILFGQIAENNKKHILDKLEVYWKILFSESKREHAHAVVKGLSDAVRLRSKVDYEQMHAEYFRLLNQQPQINQLMLLSQKLKQSAPNWYEKIEERTLSAAAEVVETDWKIAWRWQRLNQWLDHLHNRDSVDKLQNKLERARSKEKGLIGELVTRKTWQSQVEKIENHHYRALVSWSDAMREYGAGTGRSAQKWLKEAAKAMTYAVGAVPAWIMPLHRVIQSFPAKTDLFDVIITDESSQCDLRALQVLFRGKKIIVVGDPEQISPSNVGINRGRVDALARQYISDIPYGETTFHINNSIYGVAKAMPRLSHTLLTEHFRCVPEIIAFNNNLCPSYGGRLEPLRQPNPEERLEPPIQTFFIENGFKSDNDINIPEAEKLVETLVGCCRDELYSKGGKENRKRTMGIISLLGENQAKYISQLIAGRIDETERAERQIICGDAYAFQGDERDVMFLSMVVAHNAPFRALSGEADRQRFNVATSRARDQVFLFHSIRPNDITNVNCVRKKLLDWYQNPPLARIEAGIAYLQSKAESEFEKEVGEMIIRRGYEVIPQHKPFPNDIGYRIDLVIQGRRNRVAVECDGDRWHGPDKWEYDQRREAQLRRAGWKFWRISGSAFYRNKGNSLDGLWQFLNNEGIEPLFYKEERQDDGTQANEDVENNNKQAATDLESEVHLGDKKGRTIKHDAIKSGDIVKVYDVDDDNIYVYKIGPLYRNKSGYVSPSSPIGRALIGCRLNEVIEFNTPGGIREFEIMQIFPLAENLSLF